MATILEALTVAFEHHRNGRAAEAEVLYGRILEVDPNNPTALHLLGLLFAEHGHLERGAELMAQSTAADGAQPDVHHNLALVLARLGRREAAAARYARVLELDPGHAAAGNNLGLLLREMGRASEALDVFRSVIAAHPGHGEAWFNLAATLDALGRADEALAALDGARAVWPEFEPLARLYDRLSAGRRQGEAQAALALGMERLNAGDAAAALQAFDDAVGRAPDLPIAQDCTGMALEALGRTEEAARAHRRSAALDPGRPMPYAFLGDLGRNGGSLVGAVWRYRRAVLLDPGHAAARTGLGRTLFDAGWVEEGIDELRLAAALPGDQAEAHDTLLFAMTASPAVDNDTLFAEVLAYGARYGVTVVGPPHANRPEPDRTLRIGYVSGAIREGHNALYFLAPLLRHHDPERVEVFVYGDVDYAAPSQARLRPWAAAWRDTRGLDDAAVAAMIRADGIDVLVSLLGRGSQNPRTGIFRHKPAPVQTAFHHVMTSGIPAIDHWLVDRRTHPRHTTERATERLVRLPRYCQYDGTPLPAVTPPPLLRNGFATFGCFTSPWKINGPTLALWVDVLKAAPRSRLLVKGYGLEEPALRRRLLDRFAAAGGDPGCVEVRAPNPALSDHWAAYGDVDVTLDTIPYGYGNTAFEALCMGVPVVTLPADRFAGRMALSILHAAGLEEWVARSPAEYRALAAALVGDPEALARRRETLRAQVLASRLVDGRSYARAVERAYRWMWKRWCAGYRGGVA